MTAWPDILAPQKPCVPYSALSDNDMWHDLIGTKRILDKAQRHDSTCLFVFGNWFSSVILYVTSTLNLSPFFITEDLRKFC